MPALIFFSAIVLLVLLLLVSNIIVVPQAMAYVVQRLGVYYTTWGAGLHVKIPFLDRVAARVTLKEQVADFRPQPVITRDNVTIMIDTVVFFQITDPKLYAYGVEHPLPAIENLSATTLRNIIGDMELDHTLTSRDVINNTITKALDEATDKWGIKVNRVEIKNIMPPAEIQDAMEKQMKAERQRRESILRAEGEKRSAILVAEGEKESAILRADAARERRIREAQGEAEAITTVQKAYAESLRILSDANPSEKVIQLKSLEALQHVANGQATKLIVPSNIADLSGLVASLKEVGDSRTPGPAAPAAPPAAAAPRPSTTPPRT